jgi:hypothetical protein
MLVELGIPLLNLGRIDRRGRVSALGRCASDETLSSGKKSGEQCDTRLSCQHCTKLWSPDDVPWWLRHARLPFFESRD